MLIKNKNPMIALQSLCFLLTLFYCVIYFCTALNRGFDLQITYKRPLRLTIRQSGWRFFAVFNDLITFIIQSLFFIKLTKAASEVCNFSF